MYLSLLRILKQSSHSVKKGSVARDRYPALLCLDVKALPSSALTTFFPHDFCDELHYRINAQKALGITLGSLQLHGLQSPELCAYTHFFNA